MTIQAELFNLGNRSDDIMYVDIKHDGKEDSVRLKRGEHVDLNRFNAFGNDTTITIRVEYGKMDGVFVDHPQVLVADRPRRD